jgi:hypothetical protein
VELLKDTEYTSAPTAKRHKKVYVLSGTKSDIAAVAFAPACMILIYEEKLHTVSCTITGRTIIYEV